MSPTGIPSQGRGLVTPPQCPAPTMPTPRAMVTTLPLDTRHSWRRPLAMLRPGITATPRPVVILLLDIMTEGVRGTETGHQ